MDIIVEFIDRFKAGTDNRFKVLLDTGHPGDKLVDMTEGFVSTMSAYLIAYRGEVKSPFSYDLDNRCCLFDADDSATLDLLVDVISDVFHVSSVTLVGKGFEDRARLFDSLDL